MTILTVRHRTTYRYGAPVTFGDHRMMFRPRDSHDLKLLETGLTISAPCTVRWMHDVFGNSIAIARFEAPAQELIFDSYFRAEHFPAEPEMLEIEPFAEHLPFSYASDEIPDLGRRAQRQYPDPEHVVDLWAKSFLESGPGQGTLDVLNAMSHAIKADFYYTRREDPGTQDPVETLTSKQGSCRDFALLMMEAVRSLGMAAQFVSGYLYDEALIGAAGGMVGGGETHAWLQVYLPGAGWIDFDPTNALVGGRNLIRVAVARDVTQAAPLTGSFTGAPGDDLGMSVDVTVTAE